MLNLYYLFWYEIYKAFENKDINNDVHIIYYNGFVKQCLKILQIGVLVMLV